MSAPLAPNAVELDANELIVLVNALSDAFDRMSEDDEDCAVLDHLVDLFTTAHRVKVNS